jgi:hypothetical protein
MPMLLANDPPYGVSLDPTWRDGVYNALGPAEPGYLRADATPDTDGATRAPGRAHGRTKGHRNTTLSGDTRIDWSDAFALVPSLAVGYVRPRCGRRGRRGHGVAAVRGVFPSGGHILVFGAVAASAALISAIAASQVVRT